MLLVGEATDDAYHYFDENTGEEEHGHFEVVYPKYLYPAVSLINVPDAAPATIRQALDEAAELFWVSGQATVNALRKAVECLMTDQGIPGFGADKKFVPLHDRIVEFSKAHPDFKNLLTAVKLLGNAGSHEDVPDDLDGMLFDALEIVEFVLVNLYDKPILKMDALAQRIEARLKPH
ncbi:hypothetical protein AFM18_08395 [Achromobacter spanius]|uniref:DUF4145 domain-containing protein n=2 Tax=Achromobacter spanius TaxID=217203 RepID=A0AAW3I5Q6_9BURK|nr:hypothetical protein AFM18_08395 [Achromobacter spanius]